MNPETYVPFCSTDIRFLKPADLEKQLLSLNLSNVVLILSKGGEIRWDLTEFCEKFAASLKMYIRIFDVPSNPTPEDIHAALEKIGSSPIDTIIAVGGGSCIDLAKGISAFYSQDAVPSADAILQMVKNKSYTSCNGLDIIAVPTTAGTGSEVTQWATVWDMRNKEKYSIDCPQLKPKAAYVVPEFTLSLSKELTLSTGLDALCHAVEAYWSTFTTPLVQDLAYRSVELVVSNLKDVLDHPSDPILRERMCRASLLAGLAFSQTRTTACHAISYPLTMYYGVPHGFAAALSLAGVAELNRGYFVNDEALFKLFDEWGGIQEWLDYVCEGVVLLRAEAFGVKDFEMVAEKACVNGRMGNNPRRIDVQMVSFILLGRSFPLIEKEG